MKIEVNAEKRLLQGKGASRRLRKSNKVPAVVYGGKKSAESIELDHNELFYKLKMEAFHASILSLHVGGKTEQVLLRDVQWHPFKQQVLHVDFHRVDTNKKIHTKVPLHFINGDIAPGVKVSSGIVSHILTEVDISCLPKDLPEFISVDLAEMETGSSLHLSDLILPEGVEIIALAKGDDTAVATIVIPRGVLSAEDEEGAAGSDQENSNEG